MGLFGGKSRHRKEVDAACKVWGNLFEKTTEESGSDAPLVLKFQLGDSRLRYMVFCLSTVQLACARRMKNPDAVLNEVLHTMVNSPLTGDSIDPQQTANDGSAYLGEYLHRWSSYLEIVEGGNANAATGIIAGMLRHTESEAPPTQEDSQRLWQLATWIETRLGAMEGAFVSEAR